MSDRSQYRPAATGDAPQPRYSLLVPLIVGSALFMQTLDSTVIATALPAIARSMGEDPIRLNLAITSYLLSIAVFIPVSGWMADRYGSRTVFRTAIGLFALSSVLCGAAQSLPELVGARILQGIGGAMMVPVGRLVLLKSAPRSELVRAMSYLTVPAVLGPVIGPPVGGFIVTYWSWRWIFLMNVPIGIVGVVLVSLFIEELREPGVAPLDKRGFVLTGIGLACLVSGFEAVGRGVVPTWAVLALLAVGGACAWLYVMHARRTPEPIIDLGLVRIQTFSAATIGGSFGRLGLGATPFLLAMMLQIGFGLSPFSSGLITFTSAIGAFAMKFTVRPIVRLLGFRKVLIGNAVLTSAFLAAYGLFRPSTPYALIIMVLLLGGFFRSLQFTSLNILAYVDVPPPLMSRASTLASMMQQLAMSVGVGIAALILHVSLTLRGGETIGASDAAPAFVAIAALTLVSLAFFLRLPPQAGAEVSGQRRKDGA